MSEFWFWSVEGYGEVYASVYGRDGLVFRTREEAQANLDEFLSNPYRNDLDGMHVTIATVTVA